MTAPLPLCAQLTGAIRALMVYDDRVTARQVSPARAIAHTNCNKERARP
ncbi:hypothetical protein EV658_11049 [Phaeovulum veldkampii DSM 11550]|nr:hypothetical protein EV658_11049 [Phaeovulum veldkampii DSM 11550]